MELDPPPVRPEDHAPRGVHVHDSPDGRGTDDGTPIPVPPPRRRTGPWITGAVVAVVLCAGGVPGIALLAGRGIVAGSATNPRSTAPSAAPSIAPSAAPSAAPSTVTAKVGSCVTGASGAELNPDDLRAVACDSPDATLRVVQVVYNRFYPESDAACTDPATLYVFWSGSQGERGTVLCLAEIAGKGPQ